MATKRPPAAGQEVTRKRAGTGTQQQLTDVAKLRARSERALRRSERLMEAMKAFQEQVDPAVPAAGEPDFRTRRTIGRARG